MNRREDEFMDSTPATRAAVLLERRLSRIESNTETVKETTSRIEVSQTIERERITALEARVTKAEAWQLRHEQEVKERLGWERLEVVEQKIRKIEKADEESLIAERARDSVWRSQWTALVAGGTAMAAVIGFLSQVGVI